MYFIDYSEIEYIQQQNSQPKLKKSHYDSFYSFMHTTHFKIGIKILCKYPTNMIPIAT